MNIYGIVAVSQNGVIGSQGRLPWQGELPDDMRRFRQLTMGHTILMGRNTYESIGRPLEGRTNVVLSRDPSYSPRGVITASSIEEALKNLAEGTVFVIGGAQIYLLAEPLITRWYLTIVRQNFEGDTHLPERLQNPEGRDWLMTGLEDHMARPDGNKYPLTFYIKERVG